MGGENITPLNHNKTPAFGIKPLKIDKIKKTQETVVQRSKSNETLNETPNNNNITPI
jgi:hypothetical protein